MKEKGITLIALVVTIVVLLILAGISIAMLTGDNSIINQARNAKEQTEISEEKEILQRASANAAGKDVYGNITKTNLDNELDDIIGKDNYSSTENSKGIYVTYTESQRTYLVESDGNVKEVIIYDRTGISVGDYIDYSPDETSETSYFLEKI